MKTTRTTVLSLDTLLVNARKLGKESHHVARAAALLGIDAASLCVWCADKPHNLTFPAHRVPRGGQCEACPYQGEDAIILDRS